MDEVKPDLLSPFLYKPLKSRFYILFTFSLFTFLSGFLWGSWQPIMRSFNQLYNWNLTSVNFLLFMPSIVFCVFLIPFTYIWNKMGIQFVYHMSALFFLVGTFIRLCPGSIYVQSLLIQIGIFFTSFGALMALTGAPVISSLWFPSKERARATGVAVSFNTLGGAFSPVIASVMVPDIQLNRSMNSTVMIEAGLNRFLYLQSCLAVICLIFILIYFPEKPSIPPCRSSEQSLRMEYWAGLRLLLRNKQFGIIFILNFITFGVNSGVGAVFTSFVLPLGLSQKEAGVLATICSILVFLAGVLGGYLGDHFKYKKIIIISVLPTVGLYILLGLQTAKMIPYDLMSIYFVNTFVSFLTNIICPISFEMGCETAFPVSETVATGILGFATNLAIALFMAVSMIPNIGTVWIPFSYAGLVFILLPLMWFYDDKSKRKECDIKAEQGGTRKDILNDTAEYSDNCPLLIED